MPHSLSNHLSYNLWANERLGHLLMAQEEQVLNVEHKSSFPSITKTLMHLWDAEVIWLTRLKGGSIADWPSKNFKGGKAEMLKGLIETSTEFFEFIKDKDESFMNEKFEYKNMKGITYQSTVEEIIFHVVNHGTYHRGQIITMLRESGITQVVNTDMINWFREQRRSSN